MIWWCNCGYCTNNHVELEAHRKGCFAVPTGSRSVVLPSQKPRRSWFAALPYIFWSKGKIEP